MEVSVADATRHDQGAGTVAWVKCFGDDDFNDRAFDVVVDTSDNVYVTGRFTGKVNFGGGERTSTSPTGSDVFLATYDPGGTHRWTRTFGGSQDDTGHALSVDSGGDIYLAGEYKDAFTYQSKSVMFPVASVSNGFVAAFTSGGLLRWINGFGTEGLNRANGVAVDGKGRVWITGRFKKANLGGGSITAGGVADIFVARYTTVDGGHDWSESFGSTAEDEGEAVAVDGAGNGYVAGYFQNSVSFGGAPLTAGNTDGFVASFDAAQGKHRWSKMYGGSLFDYGRDIVINGAGDVQVTGSFAGSGSFAGTTLTAVKTDLFVVSYTLTGGNGWAASLGGTQSSDIGYGLAAGPGWTVVTGYFHGTMQAGPDTLVANGSVGTDILVAALGGSGAPAWGRSYGGVLGDVGQSVAVDKAGNIYVAGYLKDTVPFGQAGTCVTPGDEDIVLVKINKP